MIAHTAWYDALMSPVSHTSIRLRTEVVESLRRLTRQLAAEADRDVNQSDALGAAVTFSLEHVADIAEQLSGKGDA